MRKLPHVALLAAALLGLAGAGPDPAPFPVDLSAVQCTTRLDGTTLVRQCASPANTLLLLTTPDGRSTLNAKVKGEQVYDGPYTTPEERAKVPHEISLQLRLGMIREKANITDANEWAVMGAKIQRVLELQDQLAEACPADLFSYARAVPAPANPDVSLSLELQSLGTALVRPTPDADLKLSFATIRDARRRLADTLQSARRDLLNVSTVRHEAVFIYLGLIE